MCLEELKFRIMPMSACNPVDVSVGRCLRNLRFERGLSIADLAIGTGVTADQILAFEEGRERIGAHLILQMSNFLNVDPSDFFKMEPNAATVDPVKISNAA
jgi:transcriptional regulator with XRE-family HTH domain